MRRDQHPDNAYFNGSGLPVPVYGCSVISFSKAVIFLIIAVFPDCFQYSQSARACIEKTRRYISDAR